MLYLKCHLFQEYQPLSTLILEDIPHSDTAVENADITAAAVLFVDTHKSISLLRPSIHLAHICLW